MASKKTRTSRNHHWWPVALQSYWCDKEGCVSWITADQKVERKNFRNRKIGRKLHGHTTLKSTSWEDNFEEIFEIDGNIRDIILDLENSFANNKSINSLLKIFIKRKKIINYITVDECKRRPILLLALSLIIRSPAFRIKYERAPILIGASVNEQVGKVNMKMYYQEALKICKERSISNFVFLIIRNKKDNFVVGDGYLDWITDGLCNGRLYGRALIPLTPYFCLYITSVKRERSGKNFATMNACQSVVDSINLLTQIHSGKLIFFKSNPPKISKYFILGDFLEIENRNDQFISWLDSILES